MPEFIEYKPGEKHAVRNADVSSDPSTFRDAGILLRDDDLVIDIDNLPKKTIEEIIKKFDIKTQIVWTDRGAHFYFRKTKDRNPVHGVCQLGFEAEYYTKKNRKSMTIKRNGIMRKVINPGKRIGLPNVLSPARGKNASYVNCLGMGAGEGRNDALYKMSKKIKNVGAYTILHFINRFIFAEPLEEKEIENIIQSAANGDDEEMDEALLKAFEVVKKLRVHKYHTRNYVYDGIKYVCDEAIVDQKIGVFAEPKGKSFHDQVIALTKLKCPIVTQEHVEKHPFPIKLKNGVLKDGEFTEFQFNDFTPYYIDIDYKEDAKPQPVVDEYVNFLTSGDSEYKDLIFEMLGHCLITDIDVKKTISKFFILEGEGRNGKSTFLDVVAEILGFGNISTEKLNNIGDEHYTFAIDGKLANLGDDIPDEPIDNAQMEKLKNISSCNLTSIRQMRENSVRARLTATLIFTSNHILKSWDKGYAYARRVMWLPMQNKPKKDDPRIYEKLTTPESLEYWLKLIVDGYKRLYKNRKFTKSQQVEDFNKAYHESNNNATEYITQMEDEEILDHRQPDVYNVYAERAEENGDKPVSKKNFRLTIEKERGFIIKSRRINGDVAKVYSKK